MLVETFGGQIILATAVFLAAGTVALGLRGTVIGWLDASAAVGAAGSALAIAAVTLTPMSNSSGPGEVQLVPFRTIELYARTSWHQFVIYVGGNVVLFVPLGFFLVLAVRRLGTLDAALLAFVLGTLTSGTVEMLQLHVWTRSTDVDDLILNSLGALAGALLAVAVVLVRRLLAPAPPHRPAGQAQGVGSRAS